MRLPCRRTLLALPVCGLLLAAGLFAAPARAEYPERSARIVVGLQPGASTDLLARQIARRLTERLGQPFTVDNRPGAATRIGMEMLVRAAPDGYTLGVANAVSANFPMMFDNFEFAPGKDFVPISLLGRAPSYLAVRSTLPVKTAQEFVAYAKANSGRLTFGQGGNGSNPHLATLMLVRWLGVQATEVAYKGNAPTSVALAGGEIDFALVDYPSVRPMVERGQVRLLAVTEPRRVSMTPDIPTSGEQGLARELDGVTPWFMLVAPAGTPPAVTALLSKEVDAVLKTKEIQQAMSTAGIEVEGSTLAEAQAFFVRQRERMSQLSRELNVSLKN